MKDQNTKATPQELRFYAALDAIDLLSSRQSKYTAIDTRDFVARECQLSISDNFVAYAIHKDNVVNAMRTKAVRVVDLALAEMRDNAKFDVCIFDAFPWLGREIRRTV